MRFAKASILAAFVFTSACEASFRAAPEPVSDIEKELEAINSVVRVTEGSDALDLLQRAATGDISDAERNNFVLARMYAIDLRYSEFELDLSQERNQSDFFVKLLSIGLTGVAALSAVSETQAILAGIDTALKGANDAFSKEMLLNRTIETLTKQMRAGRDKIRSQILEGLDKPLNKYPFYVALGQLDAYYTAGTLPGALADVNNTVTTEANTQQGAVEKTVKNLKDIKTVQVEAALSDLGNAIQAWIEVDPADRLPKAQSCYKSIGDNLDGPSKEESIADFLVVDRNFPKTTKAWAACLNDQYSAGLNI